MDDVVELEGDDVDEAEVVLLLNDVDVVLVEVDVVDIAPGTLFRKAGSGRP